MKAQPTTDFQRAVAMAYHDGLSVKEIAEHLGSTVGSIKATASKLGLKKSKYAPRGRVVIEGQSISLCGPEWSHPSTQEAA